MRISHTHTQLWCRENLNLRFLVYKLSPFLIEIPRWHLATSFVVVWSVFLYNISWCLIDKKKYWKRIKWWDTTILSLNCRICGWEWLKIQLWGDIIHFQIFFINYIAHIFVLSIIWVKTCSSVDVVAKSKVHNFMEHCYKKIQIK